MKYELKNQIMWKWNVFVLYNPVYWKVKDRPEGQIIFWNSFLRVQFGFAEKWKIN